MSKFAIITEVERDNFGRINAFSRLPMAQMMYFDLLSYSK